MPDLNGRDRLSELRSVMESVLQTAASVPRSELGRELLRASQRQLELVQDVVDRERSLQGELAARVFAPLDAVFDLLQESAVGLGRQADTLESAGAALQETAMLLRRQAELFERTIGALRQPAELAKTAAGVTRRGGGAHAGGAGAKRSSGAPKAAARAKAPSAKRAGAAKRSARGARG